MIAFLDSRWKERREDSDDAGVRGHLESHKNSPNVFFWREHTGWSAEAGSEPEPVWELIEEGNERYRREVLARGMLQWKRAEEFLLSPAPSVPALRTKSPVCLHSPVCPVPALPTRRAKYVIVPVQFVPPALRTRSSVRLHSPVRPVLSRPDHRVPCYSLFWLDRGVTRGGVPI
jgi:hypothetical protein